jgi:hypothetical protein
MNEELECKVKLKESRIKKKDDKLGIGDREV